MSTVIVRSATEDDLPELAAWLHRPALAMPSAAPQHRHEHLLVAQDLGNARLLACARLRPAIGLDLPRHWYHVGCTVHAAQELALFHRQRTLLLGNDHTGASELSDLATAGSTAHTTDGLSLASQAAALRLVVQTALLLLASQRQHHAPQLIAELPGLRDGAGRSPFWHGLGRHFYTGDPAQAAARLGDAWRSHVASLLPRQPVYTSFLDEPAQAAIAQVRLDARLQREVLEEAGLRYGHHVTIDDAGPVLEADVDALPGVTQARVWTLGAPAQRAGPLGVYLVLADGGAEGPRAARVSAAALGTRLQLAPEAMVLLGLSAGNSVWALPPQPAC